MTTDPDRGRRALERTRDVLRDLARLHARGRFHGGICPAAVRCSPFGASLRAPRGRPGPVEYRDPERMRDILRDPAAARRAEPRNDLYGVGALLYAWLEGGPPVAGPASPFTRPVEPAAAWIAHRAMAEGSRRYPSAGVMEKDVRRLLHLLRRRTAGAVRPEDLPSWSGELSPVPDRMAPFELRPPRRPSRARRVAALLLLAALLAPTLLGGGTPEAGEARRESGLAALLAGWRARLDDRLRAAGEEFDAARVPLLVVADEPLPGDLGWPRHPSRELARALRAVLAADVSAGDVQRVLLTLVGDETLPAVLWLEPAGRRKVRARLYYRGVALASGEPIELH
jgi:hypothetical protein